MDDVVSIIPENTVAYGIQLPVQAQTTLMAEPWELGAGPVELAQVARQADQSGYFYVAVCDHTVIPRRLAEAMSTTWYDTVATLGWLAGITSRVRLMSHVYIAALRHPLRAAKEFATLDVLSAGRVIVGVGAGHVTEEFELLGPPFDERGSALDEALEAIALGLVDEFPELPGPRWPAKDMGVSPRPVQRPRPPIWVGGSTRPALRRAARFGDGWLPQTIKRGEMRAQVAELLEMRSEWRASVRPSRSGRWPGSSTWVNRPGISRAAPSPAAPTGSPRTSPNSTAMGVSHLQMRFCSRSADELCDQMAAFAETVAPLLDR